MTTSWLEGHPYVLLEGMKINPQMSFPRGAVQSAQGQSCKSTAVSQSSAWLWASQREEVGMGHRRARVRPGEVLRAPCCEEELDEIQL